MNIIKNNIVPVLFTVIVLGVFCGVYYYISQEVVAYRPDRYDGHSRIEGRIESGESISAEESVSLAEYYQEPVFSETAPELEVRKFDTAEEDKLLKQWLDQ